MRVFGTLLGTAEILQMLFADCDSHFVEWFSRREVTSEEQQAFEEFLFDIPYESLQKVRYRMLEDGLAVVDRTKVEDYLGHARGRPAADGGRPEGSLRRRSAAAACARSTARRRARRARAARRRAT